jgi:PAP2 superfamily
VPAPLVARRWRWPVRLAILLGVLLVVIVGVLTWNQGSTRFDRWAFGKIYFRIPTHTAPSFLDLSKPALVVGVLAVVAVAAGFARRWDLAVLAAVGPGGAVILSELALKPLFDRPIGGRGSLRGAYPSGHETGVAAAAVVLIVAIGLLALNAGIRAVLAVLPVVWSVLAAMGLVRNYYHFATDTIGAMGVSVAVVFGTALFLDRCFARWRTRVPAGVS